MSNIYIREPKPSDKSSFISAMQRSQKLHHTWTTAPLTPEEFDSFINRSQLPNQKSFLVCEPTGRIAGVFNVSEIIKGVFQNAYLGFYAVADFAGKGYMSAGLKLVLKEYFKQMGLHRLEANIQPENSRSIQLVRKNGFRYEGFSPRYLKINNEWRGHEHWAITLEDFIRDDADVIEQDHVEILPYNSEWPKLAQQEINTLKSFFPKGELIDIQHVGSTAIPGLSAKPIIDIQIAVPSLATSKLFIVPILQKIGYEFWDENPDPNRMFFVKGMPPYGAKRTHHIHIFEEDSDYWHNKIIFRDYLREHPEAASKYEKLKLQLAEDHLYDRELYTDKKLDFVNEILHLAKDNKCD